MTRICWWLVDRLSRALEPDERDAVRGDLAELGVPAGRALWDVLGLILRRQAASWKHWQPWLALFGVAVPLSMLLSLVSRVYAEDMAIHAFLYVDNWTWTVLESPGARRDLLHVSTAVLLDLFTLLAWSWSTGFVLGALSRRTRWISATVFAVVLFGEFLAVPQFHHPGNAAVFELTFYSVVFPLLLRMVVLLFPVVWGMQRPARGATFGPLATMLVAVVVVTLTARATRSLTFAGMFGWWQLQALWHIRLLQASVLLPIAYMVATAGWRQRPRRIVQG